MLFSPHPCLAASSPRRAAGGDLDGPSGAAYLPCCKENSRSLHMTDHHEESNEQPKRSTETRSVRLTPEMITRLNAVCDHLGVTVGAYLTQEIGRAVSRDEMSLLAKQSKDNSLDMLARLLQGALKEDEK